MLQMLYRCFFHAANCLAERYQAFAVLNKSIIRASVLGRAESRKLYTDFSKVLQEESPATAVSIHLVLKSTLEKKFKVAHNNYIRTLLKKQ